MMFWFLAAMVPSDLCGAVASVQGTEDVGGIQCCMRWYVRMQGFTTLDCSIV